MKMKKRFSYFISMLLIIGLLCACGNIGHIAAPPSNNTTKDTGDGSYTVVTHEVITEDTDPPEEEYYPLDIKYDSKEYKYFSNGTELRFYFTVTNVSENNIVSPACNIDILDQQGNILFNCYIYHTGAVKPGQSFDDCAIISNTDHNWEKREEISKASIVDYRDEENNCVFNNPVTISLS